MSKSFDVWAIIVLLEAFSKSGVFGGPCPGHSPAEQRRAKHRSFKTVFAVDVASGHSCQFPCNEETGYRLVMLVDCPAFEVGLHAPKVFPRCWRKIQRVV